MFGRKKRTPAEIVAKVAKSMTVVVSDHEKSGRSVSESDTKLLKKAHEHVDSYLRQMKQLLYGEEGHEATAEVISSLSTEFLRSDLLLTLVRHLKLLSFEARRDAVLVFNFLVRHQATGVIEYLHERKENLLIGGLLCVYDDAEISLSVGLMMRECFRHETLARDVLYSPDLFRFFEYLNSVNFDVSSDAFATFRDLLCTHKLLVADFLLDNFDRFFAQYNVLLESKNYATKRQSVKLLGEILLDRPNYRVMTRYIGSAESLKKVMILLSDHSKNIQFEAFHVFKVFVANPNKPSTIRDILLKNRTKLIEYLKSFHADKDDDDQFVEEKKLLIREIQSLDAAPSAGSPSAAAAATTTTTTTSQPPSSSSSSAPPQM